MNISNNEYTVLKSHQDTISSSVRGDMTELLQLCQHNVTQEHFYTYEVLDANHDIIGGRLFYQFNNPHQALDEWDNFIQDGLKANAGFTITKQEFVSDRKISLK